jgi:hypothetical protein
MVCSTVRTRADAHAEIVRLVLSHPSPSTPAGFPSASCRLAIGSFAFVFLSVLPLLDIYRGFGRVYLHGL